MSIRIIYANVGLIFARLASPVCTTGDQRHIYTLYKSLALYPYPYQLPFTHYPLPLPCTITQYPSHLPLTLQPRSYLQYIQCMYHCFALFYTNSNDFKRWYTYLLLCRYFIFFIFTFLIKIIFANYNIIHLFYI